MNDHYAEIFDLEFMDHNPSDKTIIEKMHKRRSRSRSAHIRHTRKAVGNIEDWLSALLKRMRSPQRAYTHGNRAN